MSLEWQTKENMITFAIWSCMLFASTILDQKVAFKVLLTPKQFEYSDQSSNGNNQGWTCFPQSNTKSRMNIFSSIKYQSCHLSTIRSSLSMLIGIPLFQEVARGQYVSNSWWLCSAQHVRKILSAPSTPFKRMPVFSIRHLPLRGMPNVHLTSFIIDSSHGENLISTRLLVVLVDGAVAKPSIHCRPKATHPDTTYYVYSHVGAVIPLSIVLPSPLKVPSVDLYK